MAKEKCITIKKPLIDYIETHYPEFEYEGGTSSFYAFVRKSENIFHIKNAFCKADFDAYICKTCRKILVDYSNYEDYEEGL